MWAVIIAIIVIGGAYLYWNSAQSVATPNGQTTTINNPNGTDYTPGATTDSGSLTGTVAATTTVSTGAPMSATVTYDGTKFTPSSVMIAKGGTVTFTSTAGNMWVASDEHPSHTEYDGTSRATHCAAGYTGAKPFDQCTAGASYSLTFTKAGTITYHDHLNAGARGTVTVQ